RVKGALLHLGMQRQLGADAPSELPLLALAAGALEALHELLDHSMILLDHGQSVVRRRLLGAAPCSGRSRPLGSARPRPRSPALIATARPITADQLVEAAAVAVTRTVFVQQRQAALVELPEKVIPGDRLQPILAAVAGEVDAQNADLVAPRGVSDRRGLAAALFRPALNGDMVRGGLACHCLCLLCVTSQKRTSHARGGSARASRASLGLQLHSDAGSDGLAVDELRGGRVEDAVGGVQADHD